MLKQVVLLLMSCTFLFSCTSQGSSLGLTEKIFVDEARNRSLQTYIWYPTQEQQTEEVASNPAFKGVFASLNADVTVTDKVPLYILVHGTSGNWRNQSWLAAELAVKGGIVVSSNHPGSTSGDATPSSVIQVWNQPNDISFLIDSMLSSEFGQYIDEDNIFVIGMSLGGYSAMAVSGAMLQMERLPEFCAINEDEGCKYFRSTFETFDDDFYAQANQDHKDKRVKAAIALVPGLVESMTTSSIKELDAPVLIIGAEKDRNVPPETHFHPMINYIPEHSQYREIKEASHFSFLQLCKPGAHELLAEDGEEFVCEDGGSKSRSEIHAEIVTLVETFLTEL